MELTKALLVLHFAEEGTFLISANQHSLLFLILGVEAQLALDTEVIDAKGLVVRVRDVEALRNPREVSRLVEERHIRCFNCLISQDFHVKVIFIRDHRRKLRKLSVNVLFLYSVLHFRSLILRDFLVIYVLSRGSLHFFV